MSKRKNLFNFLRCVPACVCLHVCVCLCDVCMCAGTCGGQKRLAQFLELELEVVLSSPVWVPVRVLLTVNY